MSSTHTAHNTTDSHMCSVIFVNKIKNENGEKRENNKFFNKN